MKKKEKPIRFLTTQQSILKGTGMISKEKRINIEKQIRKTTTEGTKEAVRNEIKDKN